jgi:hypothetical protein
MVTETEALRRCQRLLELMAEAMRMEQSVDAAARAADASPSSLLRPTLERALKRLEALLSPASGASVNDWLSEMVDLELEIDALIARRGWRVIAAAEGRSEDGIGSGRDA